MVQDILTAKQAAELLQTSVDMVKRKARAGEIPAAKLGREWRFSRAQLIAWVEAGGLIPEELVDRGIARVIRDQKASGSDEQWVDLEAVRAEFGL